VTAIIGKKVWIYEHMKANYLKYIKSTLNTHWCRYQDFLKLRYNLFAIRLCFSLFHFRVLIQVSMSRVERLCRKVNNSYKLQLDYSYFNKILRYI
jgi:hypothetical protein